MIAKPQRFYGDVGLQRHGVSDQAWFWAEQWQQREREVDEHVQAGQVAVHESSEDFLDHLDRLDNGGEAALGSKRSN